ncbi:RNA 2'-phosphotransferase [Thomasclavelia saccharogumia]|uniref:RNA 2'-phosphotransferase n=1 Tax=Thomasclavelia saccharogumia TaxID=341225 RepID=UPI00047ECA0C|nr:RNA 2'-phosphotransferase [Thomasclavelia saccharogumia]
MNDLTKMGKYLSLILRHKPEIIGIELDDHGWAEVSALIEGINKTGRYIDKEILDKIVETNNKKRYQYNVNQTKIRANQGHSINVDVELQEKSPPNLLYHGTAKKSLENIKKSGIKKMERLYVHLSKDVETAKNVGKRHGLPVVLVIDTKAMVKDGYIFYYSNNGVWLCDDIDYKYVKKVID